MTGILKNTLTSAFTATAQLCLKTDVAASKWIAMPALAAVFGHNSPNHASRMHKMLESTDLAQLPLAKTRKWEIPVKRLQHNSYRTEVEHRDVRP
jgi:hypothetical protein